MSNLKLAFTYLRSRALITVLTVFSVALGIGLATIVLLFSQQTKKTLSNETASWDLVVGGKGSPLQLVLSNLYFLDAPTGNIDRALWDRLRNDSAVARVIPLNMGDNYLGSPIVGTVADYFSMGDGQGTHRELARGRMFEKPFEVVAGSAVAAQRQLRLGQQIVGAHGWGSSNDLHPDFPYTVVGILTPTGSSLDRVVFTDYRSAWLVHGHEEEHHHEATHEDNEAHHADADHHEAHAHEEDHAKGERHHEDTHDPTSEITALLVQLHQPGRRFHLQEEINAHNVAQAVIPVDEISKVDRTFIAPLQGVLLVVAYLVVLVSALTILCSLYLTIYHRRRDIAILRALGATRGDVFRLITLEAALLAGMGVIVGWGLGHLTLAAVAPAVFSRFGIFLNAWQLQPLEAAVAVTVWVMGIASGLLPAVMAYRLPVADTLVRE